MKIVFIFTNSAEPDEMPCSGYVAFHLGHHCLPKYPNYQISCIQRANKVNISFLWYIFSLNNVIDQIEIVLDMIILCYLFSRDPLHQVV